MSAIQLWDLKYEVVAAYSGTEALATVSQHAFDCVLLDINMPGMDGFEVCRRLKADETTRAIPVIMVSARDADDDVINGLDAGADDYIVKPFHFPLVEARLRSALRGKYALDAIAVANEELEKARQAADDANKAKSEFLANMSHELRTPLNAVIGFSQGLLERTDRHPLNPHQIDRLQKILASGGHLLSLINDVLDISKVEAGRMEVNLTEICVQSLAREVQTMAEGLLLPKPAVRFEVQFAEQSPPLSSDLAKVRQILFNLVGNAIKFTESGVVTLRFQDHADALHMHVTDTGIGIAADQLPWIFDKFHQVRNASKTALKGTGLGLSISLAFAELLGGDLTVTSIENVGSTFTLKVPRSAPKPSGEELEFDRKQTIWS
ncbi:ATP-binding response regulator [Lignipirellula cremea]|uniref:histidine kinase n=1 Tax=Lignipirellula cremea TaxID=2528010 RepID=A0A518DVM1_9BACT|nr:response regulator [Lignipirellula cremea]QDU95873.1 Autoinducer 2 sensor kinase/phosphatase LuxQ [Lignipirellula cremea]